MNINNIFAGILGFIMAMSLTYVFWTPMDNFIDGIAGSNTELGIFIQVAWVCFVFIICILVPINLATSDDRGNQ